MTKNISPLNKGIIYALLSSLIFSFMNVLVKLTATSIPSHEIVFFRSIIGTLIIVLLMKKEKVKFSRTDISMLTIRGLCGAFYMIAYFYTISKLPLIDAILLINLSPVFVVIFSRVFLKESIPKKVYWFLPIVFVGALITINPFDYSTFTPIALVGVAAAMFSGGAGVCIRYLGKKKFHTYEVIFYFMITAAVTSLLLGGHKFVMPTALEFFYLTCIGVVSLLAQIFLTKAFTSENAVIVAVVRYIGIVFNAIWGFVIFSEVPDRYNIVGGIMIILGCIMIGKVSMKNK